MMKVIVIVFGILAAGIGGVVAVKFQLDADNSKTTEMRQKDIAAMRKSAEELQKTHPNPFKTE
jgi:hypothetical protein